MKLQKATVELVKNTSSTGYRLTVYIGIQCEQGPDYPVLLKSLSELYYYFNSFNQSESFKTAELCLRNKYNVLAVRVNTITGESSCRKFNVGNETLFFSPKKNIDYSNLTPFVYNVPIDVKDQIYSASLEFGRGTGLVNNKFLFLVPKTLVVEGEGSRFIYYCLAGNGWKEDELTRKFSLTKGTYRLMTEAEMNYTSGKFKEVVLEFLSSTCDMTIEQIDPLIYHIVADTPILDFDIRNAIVDEKTVLSSQTTDSGKNLHYCELYNESKVCTLYSKFPSAVNDLTVYITRTANMYEVIIYKVNSRGITVASESFQYSDNSERNDYITRLSYDSKLVDIDVHNTLVDLSGTYELKGQEVYYQDSDFVDSLPSDSSDESYNADICLDTASEGNTEYISRLRRAFPNALIFTDQLVEAVKVVPVVPRVTWFDTGATLKGYSYLLYLLPSNFEGSDFNVIKQAVPIEESLPLYVSTIEELDYETSLQNVSTPIQVVSNRLPIKAVLGVVAVQDLIVDTQFTSIANFESTVNQYVIDVNSLLNYNMQVKIVSVSLVGNTLSATLEFHVGTFIISSYRVTTVFNSYV